MLDFLHSSCHNLQLLLWNSKHNCIFVWPDLDVIKLSLNVNISDSLANIITGLIILEDHKYSVQIDTLNTVMLLRVWHSNCDLDYEKQCESRKDCSLGRSLVEVSAGC